MKSSKPETKEKFSIAKFLRNKALLLAALVCEVVALLIDKAVITGFDKYEMSLTFAGLILMFIYLVWDGLKRKYKFYSRKWGMGPYAEPVCEDDADSIEKSDQQ